MTHAEIRSDLLALSEEVDRDVEQFGLTLAEGVADLVEDMKSRLAESGEPLTPDAINTLALDPAKFARIRRDVEEHLFRSYTRARLRARGEVEAARDETVSAKK